jgi:hypothetical protein
MSTATHRAEQSRQQLREIWQASRDRRQATSIDDDALAHQLGIIDKRIARSSLKAAGSNRARGALRQWTQRRAALIRTATEAAHPGHAGDAAAEQAERLLLAGAPQHMRVEESLARHAVAVATKRLQELDPESLPSDFKRAREVVAKAQATHAAALLAAIHWETGA